VTAVIDFDHVALASSDVVELLQTLCPLGATVLFGRHGHGFRWALARVGEATEGINVELLEPWCPEADDFLERFVQRRGTAFHHITFKVPDIERAIADVVAAGIEPVGINLGNPEWREAFLRPRDAHGIVVQLAQSDVRRPHMSRMLELGRAPQPSAELAELGIGLGAPWLPPLVPPWSPPTAVGRRLVLETTDVSGAVKLYSRVLGGTVAENGTEVDLTWPSGVALRVQRGQGRAGVVALEYVSGHAPVGPAAALFRPAHR
jgi:methylmalonyl-CoA/ethylmalonyl-CoA epimerase